MHLERDFDDAHALEQYIVTPPMLDAFGRIAEGLRPGSGRRAWRITGDYGSGKSSFALVLAHLLREPTNPALARVRRAVDFRGFGVPALRLVPVLVTGGREGLVVALARGVTRAIEHLRSGARAPRALADLAKRTAEAASGSDVGALLDVIQGLNAYVIGAGHTGLLVVLDELGKLLEYAALHPDREDVYSLQRLAELAARSGKSPIVVLGLLHQGFHAYAERLPSVSRHEWEKVAGRFDEIVFDQPLAHTAALVNGALNVTRSRIPASLVRVESSVASLVKSTGWYREETAPLSTYPVHPMVLPVLIRFFARFGQHERSLFSFLFSSEPFGLQAFSDRAADAQEWYRLADFYDYVRAVYGHQLAGASYRSQWLRIVGVVDSAAKLDALELSVLKTIAILNVLDAEHLLATESAVAASLSPFGGQPDGGRAGRGASVAARAIMSLKNRGIVFDRGAAGGYCLWPVTSVNLEEKFASAHRALGPTDGVAKHLAPYLDRSPLLARRHSIETGTLRFFEVRYADVSTLNQCVVEPSSADGVVVFALCDSRTEQLTAEGFTTTSAAATRPDVLIAVPQPLLGLSAELQDVRCWQWVSDNTPELANDPYAAAEVARQLANSRRALADRLSTFLGFRNKAESNTTAWARAGEPVEIVARRGLLAELSRICDELYPESPLVRNELLNRSVLSGAAAAARMRLIERIFSAADRPYLGIDPLKAPPEKSMYLSVLARGMVHRQEGERYLLGEPAEGRDPLRLRPAVQRVVTLLEEANGYRVPVATLMSALRARPYGVRNGVIPLLLAIVAATRSHEIAVYENGTFLQRLGGADFLRLTKLPTAFEFQLCRVTGVRSDVFERLAAVFAAHDPAERRAELLDVVTPLCVFAAQLPEYTRKSKDLPRTARAVRDALIAAREPGTLLFHDLPAACDHSPFAWNEPADTSRVIAFVVALRMALDDLRAAYPELLRRVVARAAHALGGVQFEGGTASGADNSAAEPMTPGSLEGDRSHLAERATGVALVAREPRLRAFANRIADVALGDDAWAESLGSYVMAKPPARWSPGDEARAGDEIDMLSTTFRRVEAVAFVAGGDVKSSAVRINLTRADGAEATQVVHVKASDEPLVAAAMTILTAALPPSEDVRIAALSRLLWAQIQSACSPHGERSDEANSNV